MKNISRFLLLLATIAAVCVGCNTGEDAPEYQYQNRLVKQAFLNAEISIFEGKEVEIQGIGFVLGDKIIFRSAEGEYTAEIASIDDASAIFLAPNIPQGNYALYISRGDKTQKVASSITVWPTISIDIPEKDGCSLRGIVYEQVKETDEETGAVSMNNVGLVGVWVSDGVNFTQTDENGYYWLESDKRYGYVFVCLPSGYMPVTGSNIVPGYWTPVSIDKNLSEQYNFQLKKVDNKNHQVFFAADLHLANQTINGLSDIEQFKAGFMTDSQELAKAYGEDNTYLITLGDLTWDAHWYKDNYMPADFVKTMKDYSIPVFNCMGNHDNDPYQTEELLGSKIFRSVIAPTHYSFNLGDVHYIVVDDIMWVNTGGSNGIVGERNYYEKLDATQLAWLKEDLSHVADKTKPVVICSHCQFYNNWRQSAEPVAHLENAKAILDCFNEFKDVHVMTGHAHYSMIQEIRSNVIEHNVAAICETWWQSTTASSLSGRGINRDGTPAGYYVFELKGGDLKWYYKSIGFDKSMQFRAYNMNDVVYTADKDRWERDLKKQEDRVGGGNDYSHLSKSGNNIDINIWDWDSQWKIEVTEGNSTPLEVKRVWERDPLHTLTTDLELAKDKALTSERASVFHNHVWRVTTKKRDSDVTIKVTNRFGEVFTNTMTGRTSKDTKNSFNISQYIQ